MDQLSKGNQRFIRSLKTKKNRNRNQAFLVEGLKGVQELLASDWEISQLICTEAVAEQLASERPIVVSTDLLSSLSSLTTNESCIAVAKMRTFSLEAVKSSGLIVALDGVSDPGNLGTILRSLDWYGFDAVLCSPDCAELYNPKTIVSSMGSFTRIKTCYTDLADFISSVHHPVFGMDMEGVPLNSLEVPKNGIFVLGSESHGIRADVPIDTRLTIPRIGRAESLNVAMACTVLLHHIKVGHRASDHER